MHVWYFTTGDTTTNYNQLCQRGTPNNRNTSNNTHLLALEVKDINRAVVTHRDHSVLNALVRGDAGEARARDAAAVRQRGQNAIVAGFEQL